MPGFDLLPVATDVTYKAVQGDYYACTSVVYNEGSSQESSSHLVSSQQQQLPGGGDADADEGFASSSSVEEDQIFEVIRRKRSSHQMPAKPNGPDPIEKSRKLLHEKIKMAPLESVLWIISFSWVFYQVFRTRAFDNQVIAGWIGSILLGILMVRFSSKQKSRNEDSATSSDEQLDVHDHGHHHHHHHQHFQLKKSDGDPLTKPACKISNEFPESINRIFGASKTSFRANADDGLLCGVLLLPMVAATKLVDASSKNADRFQIAYLQVRMELVLFMSVILLLLVLTNDYSHPVKRVIRKRGLFVSSICVSALCTTLLTQFTPLAPVLTETPVAMTVLSVTMFQWFLYICVVTLKKCFTLGEMCVISQAAAVVVYGASEYICLA
ncbi:hypothetical protein BD408DRAFT_427540, partial [Parasitella parasitica]